MLSLAQSLPAERSVSSGSRLCMLPMESVSAYCLLPLVATSASKTALHSRALAPSLDPADRGGKKTCRIENHDFAIVMLN